MASISLYVVPEESGSSKYVFRFALPTFVETDGLKLHGTINLTDGQLVSPTANTILNGIAILNSMPNEMYAIVQIDVPDAATAALIAALGG